MSRHPTALLVALAALAPLACSNVEQPAPGKSNETRTRRAPSKTAADAKAPPIKRPGRATSLSTEASTTHPDRDESALIAPGTVLYRDPKLSKPAFETSGALPFVVTLSGQPGEGVVKLDTVTTEGDHCFEGLAGLDPFALELFARVEDLALVSGGPITYRDGEAPKVEYAFSPGVWIDGDALVVDGLRSPPRPRASLGTPSRAYVAGDGLRGEAFEVDDALLTRRGIALGERLVASTAGGALESKLRRFEAGRVGREGSVTVRDGCAALTLELGADAARLARPVKATKIGEPATMEAPLKKGAPIFFDDGAKAGVVLTDTGLPEAAGARKEVEGRWCYAFFEGAPAEKKDLGGGIFAHSGGIGDGAEGGGGGGAAGGDSAETLWLCFGAGG